MPDRFECATLAKKRYINTLPFLLVISSNNISILQHFPYYHFTANVTACDLEKFLSVRMTFISHVYAFRFPCKHILLTYAIFSEVRELERFQTSKMTFKIIQGH